MTEKMHTLILAVLPQGESINIGRGKEESPCLFTVFLYVQIVYNMNKFIHILCNKKSVDFKIANLGYPEELIKLDAMFHCLNWQRSF